jgi:hypothetical protein
MEMGEFEKIERFNPMGFIFGTFQFDLFHFWNISIWSVLLPIGK